MTTNHDFYGKASKIGETECLITWYRESSPTTEYSVGEYPYKQMKEDKLWYEVKKPTIIISLED